MASDQPWGGDAAGSLDQLLARSSKRRAKERGRSAATSVEILSASRARARLVAMIAHLEVTRPGAVCLEEPTIEAPDDGRSSYREVPQRTVLGRGRLRVRLAASPRPRWVYGALGALGVASACVALSLPLQLDQLLTALLGTLALLTSLGAMAWRIRVPTELVLDGADLAIRFGVPPLCTRLRTLRAITDVELSDESLDGACDLVLRGRDDTLRVAVPKNDALSRFLPLLATAYGAYVCSCVDDARPEIAQE
ncbi:MAG: hypothetical protein K1X94_14900 [Sandaracinaceae bacterium]|nr:hypothetical protein [Sandaracinaceae bacterium]